MRVRCWPNSRSRALAARTCTRIRPAFRTQRSGQALPTGRGGHGGLYTLPRPGTGGRRRRAGGDRATWPLSRASARGAAAGCWCCTRTRRAVEPVHDGGGPWWLRRTRRLRRWWACRGLMTKIALLLGAGFVVLVMWGAVSGPSRTEPEEPAYPSAPPARTASNTPAAPTAPTAPRPAESVSPQLPPLPPSESLLPVASTEPKPESPVRYDTCDDARAAGAAPLVQGDPGYHNELDRDGDGVACEPYFGR